MNTAALLYTIANAIAAADTSAVDDLVQENAKTVQPGWQKREIQIALESVKAAVEARLTGAVSMIPMLDFETGEWTEEPSTLWLVATGATMASAADRSVGADFFAPPLPDEDHLIPFWDEVAA